MVSICNQFISQICFCIGIITEPIITSTINVVPSSTLIFTNKTKGKWYFRYFDLKLSYCVLR